MAETESNSDEHEVNDPYALDPKSVREPPTDLAGRLKFLGPGFVLVGSVVGSGEIILTTTLGSMVGFSMLWFVLLSCWSKNIIQAELARFSVSSGEPFLHAFNRLPGKLPAFRGKRVSWYLWFWFIWIIPELLSSGGQYGGAGQALAGAFPFLPSHWWTVIVAATACLIVLSGTYQFLEKMLTSMVVTFTFITVICAVLLQMTPYAITWDEVMGGMTFSFPSFAIMAALACFAGTGVGANEQMAYTYWCVEKGYARWSGPADGSEDWVRRSKGWIRVMQTDVKLTLILLTCATIPFYMLGAGVLYRLGKTPDGLETIPMLSSMYTETLGEWAFYLFIAGAFFVLFSTVVSGLGANVRIFADGMAAMGLIERNDYKTRLRLLRIWAAVVPVVASFAYYFFQNPVWMLTVANVFKTVKFPLMAGGTIYLRYKHLDKRVQPGKAADALLIVCSAIIVGLAIYVIDAKELIW